jgi:tetratricopeptide (TPR) repeat protein
LEQTGRLEEAEPLRRRALAINEKVLGPDHRNVAEFLKDLALLLQSNGRLAEAEPLVRRMIKINESANPNDSSVADDLLILATLLRDLKRKDEAAPLVTGSHADVRGYAVHDDRLVVVVGPCSIHEVKGALEYAERLSAVRKELADRMAAQAGSKTFGSLSLFVQFYSRWHSSFPVAPSSFYPQPKVTSAVIRLDHRSPPLSNPTPFFHLVRTAFQKRRKQLASTLPFPKERIKQTLAALGIREDARPETLSLENWMGLFEKILTQ